MMTARSTPLYPAELLKVRNLLFTECMRRGYTIGDPPRPNVRELHRKILQSGAQIHQSTLNRILVLSRNTTPDSDYTLSPQLKRALLTWLGVDEIELITMMNSSPEVPID